MLFPEIPNTQKANREGVNKVLSNLKTALPLHSKDRIPDLTEW